MPEEELTINKVICMLHLLQLTETS